jgi:hypothetical protein
MAGRQPRLKSAFQAEMRTLVFIFSAQSNRIITNKFWSTKMSQYFCSAERKMAIFLIFYDERYFEDNFAELEATLRIIYSVTGSLQRPSPSASADQCSTLRHGIPLFIDGYFTGW